MFQGLLSTEDELETKGVSMGRFPATRGMSETHAIQINNGNFKAISSPCFPIDIFL
jgi:hypothetical protein